MRYRKVTARNSFFLFFFLAVILSGRCLGVELFCHSGEDEVLIDKARVWYQEKIKSEENVQGNPGTRRPAPTPNWKECRVDYVRTGKIVVVKTDSVALHNPGLAMIRVFVFKEFKGEIANGVILEFVGYSGFLKENADTLIRLYRETEIPGYTGMVMNFSVNYAYLYRLFYKDGFKTRNFVAPVIETANH